MTIITRKRLLKIKQWRETYGAGHNVTLPAEEAEELARIVLASLDAKPVAWTDEQELRDVAKDGCGYLFTVNPITPNADPRRVIKLYSTPPAPVVPDDGREQFETWMLKKWGRERQEYDFAMGKFLHGENYADSYTRHMWKAWSASRSTMLQAGNSPVIPDGSEDTKRLDWLDAQNKRLNEYYGTSYGWKFDANFQRNAMMLNDSNYPVMTVRQAIDKAIAAAPQQETNN